MGLIIKVIVAFCIGAAGLSALQHYWLSSVASQIRTEAARAPTLASQVKGKLTFSEDGAKLREAMKKMYGGPIDTTAGQRAAIQSAAHRAYLQQRAAQNAVPLPPRLPHVPGVRR